MPAPDGASPRLTLDLALGPAQPVKIEQTILDLVAALGTSLFLTVSSRTYQLLAQQTAAAAGHGTVIGCP